MLRIGQIDFANLYPIFYGLNRILKLPQFQFIKGPPSYINQLLNSGAIDVGPCSSIEYLRRKDMYNLIPNHSISAFEQVKSILLFSKLPILELNGCSILTSYKSETSSALLRIILVKFLNMTVSISISKDSLIEGLRDNSAYLLIGDDALVQDTIKENGLYTYDLSTLWYKYTGLPFVYALWLSRIVINDNDQYQMFILELDKAKENALSGFNTIAQTYPTDNILTEKLLLSYWNTISYDLTDAHLKGLELYRQYLFELKII